MRPLLRAGDVQTPAILAMAATLPAAPVLVERDRARDRDVERLRALGEGDRRRLVARGDDLVGKTFPLGAEHVRHGNPWLEAGEPAASLRDERDPSPLGVVEPGERNTE